jgi:hypothetical protein
MLRPDGSMLEASVGVNQKDGSGGGREPTPTTAPACWGAGANGDIARRESRREHVRAPFFPSIVYFRNHGVSVYLYHLRF